MFEQQKKKLSKENTLEDFADSFKSVTITQKTIREEQKSTVKRFFLWKNLTNGEKSITAANSNYESRYKTLKVRLIILKFSNYENQ